MKQFIILLAFLFSIIQIHAQPIPQDSNDIVWQVKTEQIFGIKFSPDSKYVLTEHKDFSEPGHPVKIQIRDVQNGSLFKELLNENSAHFSKDGSILLSKNGNTIVLRNYPSWDTIKTIETDGVASSFDLTPGKKYIANAAMDDGIKIFDFETGQKIKHIEDFPFKWDPQNGGHPTAWDVSYYLDTNKLLFSGDWAFIYDLTLDSIIHTFSQSLTPTYSPDYTKIAIMQRDPAEVFIYNSETYQEEKRITLGGNKSFNFVFSPDVNNIVTASDDYGIGLSIWSLDSNKFIYRYFIDSQNRPFGHVACSNDGKYIASQTAGKLFLFGAKYVGVNGNNQPVLRTLYPNPTTGVVKIEFNLIKSTSVNFQLSDNSGRIIVSIELGLLDSGINKFEYNTSMMTTGIYYLTIQSSSFSETFKFVKE